MPGERDETFQRRQKQWDVFREWKSSRIVAPLSLDERVAWYNAAFLWVKEHSAALPSWMSLQTKATTIMELRQRLAHLKQSAPHG